MSTEDYSPGRRANRSGGRSRLRRDKRDSSRQSPDSHSKKTTEHKPKKKKSIIQKIIGLFTGKKGKKEVESTPSAPRRESRERSTKPFTPRTPRTSRPLEIVEVTTPRIYVGNLSYDATESDLQELFSGVGLVQNVEIVSNKDTQRSKGFGFVQMQTIEEAKRAVAELHDKEYMSRKLVVSGAKADDRRS